SPPAPDAPNLAPGAFTGEATTSRNVPVQIFLAGADPEDDSLFFSITSAPLHGTLGELTHAAEDSAFVTYTPNDHFLGLDEFHFQVNDGTHSSLPGRIQVEVINTDPPPVRVVVVPGLHRVSRDNIAIEGDAEVSIKTARGETESCQVVVVN